MKLVRSLFALVRLVAIVVVGSFAVTITVAAITPRVRDLVTANESQNADIELDQLALTSFVYASDGSFIDTLHGPINRKEVKLADISQKAQEAILSVEDADFYSHAGVNARAIGRALIRNVSAGGTTASPSRLSVISSRVRTNSR